MRDDDLIRRSDALAACRYDDAHDCRDAIAALPAVQIRPDYFAMAMQDDGIAALKGNANA